MPSTAVQPGLFEAVFAQMPVGVAIFDRSLRLRACNETWAGFWTQYAHLPAGHIRPGVSLYDLMPGDAAQLSAMCQQALAGEPVHHEAARVETAGSVSYWDVLLSPTVEDAEVTGMLAVTTEATDHVQSYHGLERRVQDRTHELATLLEVARNMASTLELQPLLGLILDQLRAVVPYDGASVFTLDGEILTLVAYRGPIPESDAMGYRFLLAQTGANRSVVEGRSPIIIPDVRADSPLALSFQEAAGPSLATTFSYVSSWLGVPLLHKEQVIGMLSLDHGQANYYTARHAQLALAFAGHVAVALANARLYEAEQERRLETERRRAVAEGLRDILTVLNSNRSLDEILAYIVAQAGRLLGTEAGAIYRLDAKTGKFIVQASQGLPEQYVQEMQIPTGQGAVGMAVQQRRPVVVNRMADLVPPDFMDDPVRRTHVEWLVHRFESVIAVPLVIKDEIYGGIVLYFGYKRDLARDEVELVVAFSDQAALAIENARLRNQAEQAAVTAERSRLARDLHDAVTQTLFSASLIADVLPRLWERQPAEGLRRLEELRQLTRGALAEMRALLLELRPSALTEASLGDLLRQLAEAMTGRARIPVQVTLEGQGTLPPDAQIVFYRIAQEALNNIAKHSGATQAALRLRFEAGSVELCVIDDGQGFDLAPVSPDHLGLGIMRERAATIGATLNVASRPGDGTQVTIHWPANPLHSS
jgi:signal transduction histidine kinase